MKKIYKFFIAVVLITTAFLVFYQQKINYEKPDIEKDIEIKKNTSSDKESSTLAYNKVNSKINGCEQNIYTLEIDVKNNDYSIIPILSHDSIFGFETTSSMARSHNVIAAINGGFFYPYGQPSGIIIIDGKLNCSPRNNNERIVFAQYEDNSIAIEEKDFSYNMVSDNETLKIDGINREPLEDEIILYTEIYGLTNRVNGLVHYNVLFENNHIKEESMTLTENRINPGLGILTATGSKMDILKNYYIRNQGYFTEFKYNSEKQEEIISAFEGGFWVVKDYKSVVKERENWVGLTTNREPRTAIGIKKNGNIIMIVVDGRQLGYSIGFTGKELAQYLILNEVKDAIMLDGGASSTMIVKDKIVNSPSDYGKERMIGGAIGVKK